MNELGIPVIYKQIPEVREILEDPAFESMRRFRHHGSISCYQHSLRVTEIAFLIASGCKADILSTIRGALLHDFYLYDWHGGGPSWHGYRHPALALREALKRFELNSIEKDIIKKHMFPLTPLPPVFKESWIVTWADKNSAITDYAGLIREYLNRKTEPAASV